MSVQAASDPTIIGQWRRLDARLTSSGQPTAEEFAMLAAMSIGHVVNLSPHHHPQALPGEPDILAALGLDYVHIPVDFAEPAVADYARFAAVMDAFPHEAVHVHCIANLRVSAFLYRYRRARGVDEAQARAEMESLWRPGGAWAAFVGRQADVALPHRYAGRDY